MYKAIILTAVATLTIAQDFPLPDTPKDYITQYTEFYSDSLDTNADLRPFYYGWTVEKWSSTLNVWQQARYAFVGSKEILIEAATYDSKSNKVVTWKYNQCKTSEYGDKPDVATQIANQWKGAKYLGNNPELHGTKQVLYHTLQLGNTKYHYLASNLKLRYAY